MPTYEYECDSCGHSFEKFQQMSARPVKKCPECGLNKVRRLIGIGAGVIFKGSGFYQTDYKKSSSANNSKDKPAAKTEAKPAESKSDAGASKE